MSNWIQDLERLRALRDSGDLSEPEFEEAKKRTKAAAQIHIAADKPLATEADAATVLDQEATAEAFGPDEYTTERPKRSVSAIAGFTIVFGLVAFLAAYLAQNDGVDSKLLGMPIKVTDPVLSIGAEAAKSGWQTALQKWSGKYVEFRFLPDGYEGEEGYRVLTSTDSPVRCPIDDKTFLLVQSRKSRFIIIKGVIKRFNIDTPIDLDRCEVVKLDTEGWEPSDIQSND